MRPTRRPPPSARPANTTCASTSTSRSATGIEWLDERQPTIRCSRSSRARSAAGHPLADQAGAYARLLRPRAARRGISLVADLEPGRQGGRVRGHDRALERRLQRGGLPALSHAGGRRRGATAGHPTPRAAIATPAFSPGRQVACSSSTRPQDDEVYHLARLQRVAWPAGGETTLVARDFDREVGALRAHSRTARRSICWSPRPARKPLPRAAAGGEADAGHRARHRRLYRLTSPQKASKPVLIATMAARSARPRSCASIRRRSARQPDPLRHRRGRRHRLAPPQHFWLHQRQGAADPQHDRAAARLRCRRRSTRCWCSSTAARPA